MNFKKIISIIFASILLTSCSGNNPLSSEETILNKKSSSSSAYDIDLVGLSSTMLVSQINDMVFDADKYVDKTVRITGNFYIYVDELTGNKYYSCLLPDPTGCCLQGFEFQLKDTSIITDDYPTHLANIEVVGVYATYDEGEITYCYLKDATMTVLD